ncbi:hypothetical protein [Spirosoma gilvum]
MAWLLRQLYPFKSCYFLTLLILANELQRDFWVLVITGSQRTGCDTIDTGGEDIHSGFCHVADLREQLMKTLIRRIGITGVVIAIVWTILTIWAESAGPKRSWKLGSPTAQKKVLIVYDPDPFYNLDQQISCSFGQALADHGLSVWIASVAAIDTNTQFVDSYVFCANTYNWRPDWVVSGFIRQLDGLAGKPVVAITLGAGSTEASQKALEKAIEEKKGMLLDSRCFWAAKPNDETRINESNSQVAVSMAYEWGEKIAEQIKHQR